MSTSLNGLPSQAANKMCKVAVLCLRLQTKSERGDVILHFFFFFFSRTDGNTDLSTFGLEKLLKHLYQDLNSPGLFMMIFIAE